MQTETPFYIYINDIPCRITPTQSQMVGEDSCLIIPRQFLRVSENSGEILLRDVTSKFSSSVNPAQSMGAELLEFACSRQGFLLLPDPVTGLVRVERYHFYQTVRFVGEHLLLTGSFHDFSVVVPSTSVADADAINALTTPADKIVSYKNSVANEMLGFARYLVERSGGTASIAKVTSDWHLLPEEVKARYCADMTDSSSQ